MRGADVWRGDRSGGQSRFIPTCVGQIYPDVYAEMQARGSSPHAWGRCSALRRRAMASAVHPHMRGADARAAERCQFQTSVHPHMRGADWSATSHIPPPRGSSPHAWGRFQICVLVFAPPSVHPHMRGADATEWQRELGNMRFIPTCVGQIRQPATICRHIARFIPTCVGRYFPKQSYCLIFIS